LSANQKIKVACYVRIKTLLEIQISDLEKEIKSTNLSKINDTKSSAGDKFETGRAMIQIELDKLESQLNKANQAYNELLKIDVEQASNLVQKGSLVITNQESYFLAIAFGKVKVNDADIYAISLASPVGSALFGKQKDDEVQVNGRLIRVIELF